MDSTNVKGLQRLISAPYESKILGITILYEIITRRTLIKKIDKEIKKINKPEPLISAEPPSIDIDFLGRKAIWDELKRKFSTKELNIFYIIKKYYINYVLLL